MGNPLEDLLSADFAIVEVSRDSLVDMAVTTGIGRAFIHLETAIDMASGATRVLAKLPPERRAEFAKTFGIDPKLYREQVIAMYRILEGVFFACGPEDGDPQELIERFIATSRDMKERREAFARETKGLNTDGDS